MKNINTKKWDDKLVISSMILLLIAICFLSSCGPSAEEKAYMEKQKEERGEIPTISIKVNFTNGTSEIIKYKLYGELDLDEKGYLYDVPGKGCCSYDLIARNVDSFNIVSESDEPLETIE